MTLYLFIYSLKKQKSVLKTGAFLHTTHTTLPPPTKKASAVKMICFISVLPTLQQQKKSINNLIWN